ncbi:hypothetical protein B0T12DRAFT_424667 [Alternaria alternata]|nr:hypothetical protein B0T12DRAFT_424667 [Alternaria alternata]
MLSASSQPRDWPWSFPKQKVLLKDDSAAVNVRITDIAKDSYTSTLHTSPNEAEKALSRKALKPTRVRLISIYSRRTISALDITNSLLEHVFNKYRIPYDFADVVASFGQDPNIAEGSSSNATVRAQALGDCNLVYQIRYVEQNRRGGQDPWSFRHTGVFHRYDEVDTVVLLHSIRTPSVETIMKALETDVVARADFCNNPFLLHTWVFRQYFDNWRWYFRYLGERFAEENNLAMVVKPEHTEPSSSFLRVQRLRNTNDFILFARACCSGNLTVMEQFSEASIEQLSQLENLSAHKSKMKGYIESADVLKGRVQNLIDLVGYTLTLHNQLEAAKIDTELRDLTEGLKKLTEDTVDDSATVKIITFVSAVYLPGNFIASIFGMNLFLFNPVSKRLQVSPDFWIFIATWIPLIVMTGAIYVLILYLDSRIKRKPFRWPLQMKPHSKDTASCSEKGKIQSG